MYETSMVLCNTAANKLYQHQYMRNNISGKIVCKNVINLINNQNKTIPCCESESRINQ